MDNTARGVLAEFLVVRALRQYIRVQPRVEWDSYDLRAQIHGREVSVEVKSSSKVQSWTQRKHSPLQFRIAPTRKWDPQAGRYRDPPLRADIYVFSAFTAIDVGAHAVALNVDHWRFRVALGAELPDQKTITWNGLSEHGNFPECEYRHLAPEVEAIANRVPR